MNQKKILDDYLIKLYNVYEKNNFENFEKHCLNYNIKIGDYEKNISKVTKNIFKNIISKTPLFKAKTSYIVKNQFCKLSMVFENNNYPIPKIIVLFPVFIENYEKLVLNLFEFLANNEINFVFKLRNYQKNPIFEIKLDKVLDCKNLLNHIKISKDLKDEVYSRILPFFPQENLIGITTEYKPFDYNNFFIKKLFEFMYQIKSIDELNSNELELFFEKKYKLERNLNTKRMIFVCYKSINIINTSSSVYDLFVYNSDLMLGSMNPNEFELKTDADGMVFFKNIDDGRIISFGSEDYLNLSYSKFYENMIRKEENDVFYSYFYNIYSKILSNNFENIQEYLNFSTINKDRIYQIMMVVSSCFFAYKKMNFTLSEVNEIISYVLLKNMNIKLVIKKEEEYILIKKNYIFPLSIEYGNKVVNLKDGSKTVIKIYFEENKIDEIIPISSIVYTRDGKKITGEKFLKDIYLYIDKYDSFKDLKENLIEMIEYK